MLRYRCHVGHAFGEESLLTGQSEQVEQALYAAVRALDENAAMARRAAARYATGAFPHQSLRMETKARDLEEAAAVLRRMLRSQRPAEPATGAVLTEAGEPRDP